MALPTRVTLALFACAISACGSERDAGVSGAADASEAARGGAGGLPATSDAPAGSAGSAAIGSGGATPDGSAPDGAGTSTDGATPGPTCPEGKTLTAGESTRTLESGGLARTYILHVPASYTGAEPVPLVLDFHPLFGTGALQRASSGYLALSDAEGFIVAFPDGIDNAWNIGPCCTRSRSVDDVAFARAMVAEISAEGCIDPKRVYATGFSMGGGMSYHLACNAADVFAAVAPSAFDLLVEAEQPCRPVRPISVVSFRGTADLIVPYSGGASNPPNGLPVTIHFLGAEVTFETWSRLDGCSGSPLAQGPCQTRAACAGGVEVTLCTAVGGGHVSGDARMGWDTLRRYALP